MWIGLSPVAPSTGQLTDELASDCIDHKLRGVTQADIDGKPAEFALPKVLVQLSLSHDRLFNY